MPLCEVRPLVDRQLVGSAATVATLVAEAPAKRPAVIVPVLVATRAPATNSVLVVKAKVLVRPSFQVKVVASGPGGTGC
jgi:hypothetical protein